MRGYLLNTGSNIYVLRTDKKRLTVYMIAQMLRKIVEVQHTDFGKMQDILHDRTATKELRNMIEVCDIEEVNNIYIAKTEGTISTCPVDNGKIVVFEEEKENSKLKALFQEVKQWLEK